MIINADCTYITASGTVVDYSQNITAESAKYKYGGDTMAEYLDHVDGEDDWTGSVEWDVYVRRFGKRLLLTDDRGFVWVQKYATAAECQEAFASIDAAYCKWSEEND